MRGHPGGTDAQGSPPESLNFTYCELQKLAQSKLPHFNSVDDNGPGLPEEMAAIYFGRNRRPFSARAMSLVAHLLLRRDLRRRLRILSHLSKTRAHRQGFEDSTGYNTSCIFSRTLA